MYSVLDSPQPIWSRILQPLRSTDRVTALRIRALAEQLQYISRQTEPDFVKLAERLNALHTGSLEIGSAIEAGAGTVRHVLQDETLYGERGIAARLLREFRSGLQEIAGEQKCLVDVESALQVLAKEAGGIEDVTRSLAASLAGFAIETARSAASASAFGAFVEDLRAIVERLQHLGDAISEHAVASRRDLVRQIAVLDGGLLTMRRVAESCESTLAETERRVHSSLARNSDALSATKQHAQRLSVDAAEAVYHLQFGDIVRQKLEHAAHALGEAAVMLDGSGPAASRASRSAASAAGDVVNVQSAQLERIIEEVTTACAQLSAAFQSVAAHTRDLVSDRSGDARTAELDDCQVLSSKLRELAGLRSKSLQLLEESRSASERASDASTQVTSWLNDVESINHEMHIQALNAIIVTELLGSEGRTLGVLSMFLHQGYQRLNDQVTQIAGAISRINGQTSRMHTQISADADANPDILAGIERLTRTQAEFAQSRDSIWALAESQTENIENARSDFEFLSGLTGDLTNVLTELHKLKRDSRWTRGKGAREALATLSERYTMESEREIHRRVTEQTTGNTTRAVAPASEITDARVRSIESQELHRFDENIELF